MSKQAKTYMLLAFVLAVWGVIGFKVIKALSPEPEVAHSMPNVVNVVENKVQRDTFTLYADYRDPFLGTLKTAKPKIKKPRAKKTDTPKKKILYAGLISESGSKGSLFFVTIDGQQHIMSPRQEINGVRLVKGSAKSIQVTYGGINETISLSE
nr:hypothetical protein [Allomuricauda sp.]